MRNRDIKQEIKSNNLTLPTINTLKGIATSKEYATITRMFEASWRAYVKSGKETPISLPYWAKQIKNPKLHNRVLKVLSDTNWFTVSTRPNNNWSEAYLNESKLLEYCTQSELDHTRMFYKFENYKLENKESTVSNLVKQGKSTVKGMTRTGFMKAGNTQFQFNTDKMYNNKDIVVREINKGIEKMAIEYPQIKEDHANYANLGLEIIDALIAENGTYSSGERKSDPRGRDIAGYLNKIGNPIGFKVMRSLLVIPEEFRNTATNKGLTNKFLFIAELIGFKQGTLYQKSCFGKRCYRDKKLSGCDVENLWIENTYADIDAYYADFNHKWRYPVEIDMSASCIGFMGLLLNHKPFLNRCNILHGELSDAWGHETVTNRDQFKSAIMRRSYGSQMASADMWKAMDIAFTQEDVNAIEYELEHGEMAVANALKDFMIDNCKMQPEMKLILGNEKLNIKCNRHHNVGEITTAFDLFDTHTDTIRRVYNTSIKQVPDLNSFRRWSVTGLIHGLDSQVMNSAVDAVMNQYNWVLPIHDAMILCCEAADYGREIYANGRTTSEPSLKWVHTNRNSILSKYFTSINIPGNKIAEFKANVMSKVEPLTEELVINPLVLK